VRERVPLVKVSAFPVDSVEDVEGQQATQIQQSEKVKKKT